MRSVAVTVSPPLDLAPDVFGIIADSPGLVEARLQEWNPADDESITAFYVCEGDPDAVVPGLEASHLIRAVSVTTFDPDRFGLLVRLDRGDDPLVEGVFAAVTSAGLIVRKPVVYRDGAVRARLIGDDETLAAAIDRVPDVVDVTVESITSLAADPAAGVWGLTPRQREALRAALAMGYYERPRRATHADVADAMGCASSTASEHLEKAEAQLVRAAMPGGI